MRRRDLFEMGAALAASQTVSAAPAKTAHPARMKIGTQHGDSDEILRTIPAFGGSLLQPNLARRDNRQLRHHQNAVEGDQHQQNDNIHARMSSQRAIRYAQAWHYPDLTLPWSDPAPRYPSARYLLQPLLQLWQPPPTQPMPIPGHPQPQPHPNHG